jgi:cysteine synthase A
VFAHVPSGPVAAVPVEVEFGATVSSWSFAALPRKSRPALLFVESNTTGTGMLALRTAVRLGLEPVFLTTDPERYAGLTETGCRVVVCDTDDAEALRVAAEAAVAGRTVAGVTTTSEYYLVPAAVLAAGLGVVGNPPDALATCRNKASTRAALRDNGVAQPHFVAACSVAEAEAAVAEIGLPCVVKPADDSGSHDVLWCADAATAVEHAARVLAVTENVRGQATAQTVLIEEFLDGREYSVEMFCVAGQSVCVGVTERTVSELPYFVETGHLFPARLGEQDAAAVAETARQALKAVGFERGPAHVEVKVTSTGPAIVEINARLAGGMIPELIRPATGIDLLDQQIRAAAGRPVRLEADRSRHAGIRFLTAPRPGRLVAVTGVEEAAAVPGVDRVTVTGVAGREVRPVRDAYDRLGYVIAVGDSPELVSQALDAALAAVEIVVEGEER